MAETTDIIKIAEEKTKELLDKLSLNYSEISALNAQNDAIAINIKGDNLGILIGFHGRNLDSLKNILSLIINKAISSDTPVRIYLDINEYSEKRVLQLKTMLENALTVIQSNGKEFYSFPPMNSSDRRILHNLASEMSLKTESEGEGRERHVKLLNS